MSDEHDRADRADWPDPPAPSPAARLQGRPGYRVADRLERRLVRRRLSYPFTGATPRAFRRRDGRLLVLDIDPAATGRSAAAANLDLVANLCEAAGVEYFLVPGPNEITARLAVPDDRWDDLADALAAATPSGPVYVEPGRDADDRWPVPLGSPLAAAAVRGRDAVTVYRPVATSTSGRLLGPRWGTTIERWRAEGPHLLAPERNSRAQSVPRAAATATVTRSGRAVPTLEVFARPHLFDVDFPIDVVYLWVDGDDPQWRARKAAALGEVSGDVSGEVPGEVSGDADGTAEARFRDGGELKYSLRSLAQYAPWVRRVFLVTDRQVPSWLDPDEPRLTVVDHRELFGDEGTLPTFNSHAIGARLHHIDGLAEHYLYLNDDVFFGRDVTPDAFFEASGLSKFFLSRSSLAMSEPGERQSHESARRNVAELVERDFGRSPGNIFYHSPIPQRRSTMAELEARYPDEFRTTWNNRFRSHTDIEPNSWLHHYVGYLLGRAVPARIGYTYVQLDRANAPQQLADLARARDRDVFCVNDHADATAEQHAFGVEWLARYFPVPSPFERTPPPGPTAPS